MARRTEILSIEGMHCAHCVSAVRGALEQLRGVRVDDVTIGTAQITFDPDEIDSEAVKEAVDEEGYNVVSSTPAQ